MFRGLSWDGMKRRLAAVVVIATMALPGVASAAETAPPSPSDATVTYDNGQYVPSYSSLFPSYGGAMTYSRGTSWS